MTISFEHSSHCVKLSNANMFFIKPVMQIVASASPSAAIPSILPTPENGSSHPTLHMSPSQKITHHNSLASPGSLEYSKIPNQDMSQKTMSYMLKEGAPSLVRNEAGALSAKRISWREPLCDVILIPKEGKSRSVREFHHEVNLMRQRRNRAKELALMRSFFDESLEASEDKNLGSKMEYHSSDESLFSQYRKSYDLSQPIFTFKQLNYEPAIAALPSTSDSDSHVGELSEFPVIHSILQKSLQDQRNLDLLLPRKLDNKTAKYIDLNSKVDPKLSMRRNMLARMPQFLRCHESYDIFLTSKSDKLENCC